MMTRFEQINRYVDELSRALKEAEATDSAGRAMATADAMEWAIGAVRETHDGGNRIMFIGNGGSAGIASHMATDFLKNGRMRATAFNDGAALTCLANDLGYEHVFSEQIAMHAREGDLLIAISSSGGSANILRGVDAARGQGCRVLTLSGFQPDNPLRRLGDYNLWVDSREYGFVEIAHLALCHTILDLEMGWTPEEDHVLGTSAQPMEQ